MTEALTDRQAKLLEKIESIIEETKDNSMLIEGLAHSLTMSNAEVLADLMALEAAKKIRRIGSPMVVKAKGCPDGMAVKVVPILSAAERVRRYRETQKSKGRKKVELWLTPEEEESVRRLLEDLRKHGPSLFD